MVIKLFTIQCRHRCYYLLDRFNYIDVPAVVFTALIIPFRIAGYKTQWIFASLSYLFNGLRAFKYASVNQWVLHSPIIYYIIELCKTHCVQLYRGQEPCPQRFLHVEDSLKLLLMLVKPLHAWIVKTWHNRGQGSCPMYRAGVIPISEISYSQGSYRL